MTIVSPSDHSCTSQGGLVSLLGPGGFKQSNRSNSLAVAMVNGQGVFLHVSILCWPGPAATWTCAAWWMCQHRSRLHSLSTIHCTKFNYCPCALNYIAIHCNILTIHYTINHSWKLLHFYSSYGLMDFSIKLYSTL